MSTIDPHLAAEVRAYEERYSKPKAALLAAIEEAKKTGGNVRTSGAQVSYLFRGLFWPIIIISLIGLYLAVGGVLVNHHAGLFVVLIIVALLWIRWFWNHGGAIAFTTKGMTEVDRLRERLKALEAQERRQRYSPVRDAMLSAGGLAATLDAMSSNPTDARQGMVALAMIELQKQRNMNVRNAMYDSAAEEARMRMLGESIADAMMARVAEQQRQNPTG